MSTHSSRDVAALIMYDFLSYRLIRTEDAQLLMGWRTSPTVAKNMFTEIERNLNRQIEWIESCNRRTDFKHRIIRIENNDVGYCSIKVTNPLLKIGELGVYIGDPSTPRELSIYNFLGTANHALFTMGLKKLVNQILDHNDRTLRLQAFNGYLPVGTKKGEPNELGYCPTIHSFELTRERWHEFRNKFGYYKDWDGNLTGIEQRNQEGKS